MDKKVNVCVVGCGIGHTHTDCYKRMDNLPLAVCDIDVERGQAMQKEFGIKKFYQYFDEMIKDPEIEAVDVCTPNYLHVPMVIKALEAGKHVSCEKPMSINGTEAAKVIEVNKKAKKTVLMAFCYRFRDDLMWIRKKIDEGVIGNVIYSRADMIRQAGIPGWGSWFTTKELSGGGTLADCGVHIIDLTHWVTGQKKVKSVSAYTNNSWGIQKKCCSTWGSPDFENGKFDVDDFVAGQIRYEDGTIMNFENSWAAQTDDSGKCIIVGDKGGFIWDLMPKDGHSVKMFTREGDVQLYTNTNINCPHGHYNELKHFIECINKGEQCTTTVEDGVEMMRIIDAIYKSAETCKEEMVEY